MNRIAGATSSAWGLTFGYDSWANLLSATGTGTAASFNLPANANNHITTAPFAYDAAGNETADAAGIYTWNAEGELKTAGGVTYTYDGDGHRVQKSNGKLYWYGGGEVIEESDAAGNMQEAYVFFGGKRIANRVVSSGAISYYAEDFIGSSRVITTSVGATCYDADFYPYGSESNVTNTCAQNYKWTGKERDAETGNDDFDARYYSPVYGRFLSADWSAVPEAVPYANLTNPQTLNLYAIVNDNPESYADLDGHDPGEPGSGRPCNQFDDCTPPSSAQFFRALSGQPPQDDKDKPKPKDRPKDKPVAKQPPPSLGPALAGIGAITLEGSELGPFDIILMGGATVYYAAKNKKAIEQVIAQLEVAAGHINVLNNDPGKDPRNHWRKEIRNSIKTARKWANRMSDGMWKDNMNSLIDMVERAVPQD